MANREKYQKEKLTMARDSGYAISYIDQVKTTSFQTVQPPLLLLIALLG